MNHKSVMLMFAFLSVACAASENATTNGASGAGVPKATFATNEGAKAESQVVVIGTNAPAQKSRMLRHVELYEIEPMTDEQRRYYRTQHVNRTGKDLVSYPAPDENRRPVQKAPREDVNVIIE